MKFYSAHSIQAQKKQLKNVLLWSFAAALSCDFRLTSVAHARICASFRYNRAFLPGFASIVNALTRFCRRRSAKPSPRGEGFVSARAALFDAVSGFPLNPLSTPWHLCKRVAGGRGLWYTESYQKGGILIELLSNS